MELAIASLHPPVPLQVVPSSATECATVVRGRARPVALPAYRSCHVEGRITLAEVGRALVVEEIEGEFLFGSVRVFVGEEVLEAGVGFLAAFLRFRSGKRKNFT